MLVEKYRPKSLAEVILPDAYRAVVEGFISEKDPPHLLLYGPPGTGKTSLAVVIAREIFGEDFENAFFESNASSERGLDFVRRKIKSLAKQSSLCGGSFKIVFLDEADALTFDAQNALRRIIEEYSSETRFFLSCNRVGKIIQPIRSRCFEMEFSPLESGALVERLLEISEEEGIEIDPSQLREVVFKAAGDARKAIGYLEAIRSGLSFQAVPAKLLSKTFEEFLPLSFQHVPGDMLSELHREAVELQRGDLLVEIAEADFKISQGTLGVLQLQALFFKLSDLLDKDGR